MRVLFIGDVFEEKYEEVVNRAAKAGVEYSSVSFQRRILSGFEEANIDVTVLSAPAIGAYPQKCRWVFFKAFGETTNFRYVSFCNIWGYRNLSRSRTLKSAVRRFLNESIGEQIHIYVYSAHNPFISAARYAKSLRPDIRVCLIVPDLPQYMNLENNRSKIYDLCKFIDKRAITNNSKSVDAFVVLTEQMKEKLPIGAKPCIVQEGIVQNAAPVIMHGHHGTEKKIVYTGKLYTKFGIQLLVDVFMKMNDPNLKLVLCGAGDAKDYVIRCVKKDSRIDYRGFVSPDEVDSIIRSADVLVNPRINDNEYTKYSFPSKNLEYLLSGHPVVACLLDGMPQVYQNFMYCFTSAEDLEQAICSALTATDYTEKYQSFLSYASSKLTAVNTVSRMIKLLGD